MYYIKVPFFLFIFSFPVYSGNNYVRYTFDKNKTVFGDSVTLSWEAPKRYVVKIEGIDSTFNNIDKIKLIPKEKEKYTIIATKGKKTITRKTRSIKIIYPQLHYFIATRLPEKSENIQVQWKTENYKTINIDKVGNNLEPSGQIIISEPKKTKLSLEAINYVGEKLVQYVSVPKDYSLERRYIKGDTILSVTDSTLFYMEIVSVNISKYPELIELKVIVYDTLGNYITGLAPPYTTIADARNYFRRVLIRNHYGEKTTSFNVREYRESEENKIDIAFVMDHSGSMNYMINSFKDIASYFISEKNKSDRMSLTVFDHRIYKLNDLTSDTVGLINSIKNNDKILGGSTALYAASDEGLQNIRYSPREKYLLIFTDGRENSSFPYNGYRATNANELSNKIRKTKTNLYIIGYGNNVNYEVLEKLSDLSNGKFYYISNLEDLKSVLFEIGFLMKNYYSITFKPPEINGISDIDLIYRNFNSDMILKEKYCIGDIDFIEENLEYTTINTLQDSVTIVFPPQVLANFQFNKSFIEEQYKNALNSFVNYLNKHPDIKILITGHSDSKGKEPYRQKISEKRAESVADYLIKKGIDKKRIRTEYYSFSRPVHPKEEYEWQARENRRVEIVLYKTN